MTLQHIVAFKFDPPLNEADRSEIVELVSAWPEKIGTMSRLRFGGDITLVRNAGYEFLLLTEFDSMSSMEAYRAHPVHKEFERWIFARGCTAMAFDYELDSSTVLIDE